MSSHQAVEPLRHPGRGGRGCAPRQVGIQCAQYLLFFRPEEEDLPGLNGFEPEELPPPLGFLGAGLSLSEPDEEPEYFSLFLALPLLPLPLVSSSASRLAFRLSFSLASFSASSQS